MILGVAAALVLGLAGCGQSAPDELTVRQIMMKSPGPATPKYGDLVKAPSHYRSMYIGFEGTVFQVVPDQHVAILNVIQEGQTGPQPLWLDLKTADPISEGDVVKVAGIGTGLTQYVTVGNAVKTLPRMDTYRVELVTKAGDGK